MINEEKQKALEAALGHIEKQYGKGSVMKLGDSSAHMQVEAIPTGSLGLDIALGHFAEFLDNASSAGLRILSSSTCVGLRYGYLKNNSGFS